MRPSVRTDHLKRLTLSAMFLAMGMVLPLFFGQIPQIGSMLLPMHIPVFLCAFICGWHYAVPMAALLPLLRSLLFARPNFYPEAIAIACEMAAYALVAGLLYQRAARASMGAIYQSMVVAMVAGRVLRVAVQLALLGLGGIPFALGAVLAATVVVGLPGTVLQLIVVPAAMLMLYRTKLVTLGASKQEK